MRLCYNLVYTIIGACSLDGGNSTEDQKEFVKMKKLLSLILAAIMVCTVLASCSTLAKGDKGAIITMYLAEEIYDYDPAKGFNDLATAKIVSLMFEGLTTLDKDGDWHKGMMEDYEYFKPSEKNDNYRLQISLRDTKWSDGRTVQANDFVYAWKRIMEPTFKCEAAALLYDLVNAREIKMGDATVDDLGVYAVDTYTLEIEFVNNIDVDEFFKKCASLALVPLREDKVNNNEDWAKRASSMVTNGPFDVRKIDYGKQIRLERSAYYYRDTDSNQHLDKYVIPYRLVVRYDYGNGKATTEQQIEKFNDGTIFYLGEIALSARGDYEKKAKIKDSAITTTLYFNLENELFADAKVRKALSLALDREAIADMLVFAKAATGFVPYNVDAAGNKGDFRKTADKKAELLSTDADVAAAKKLLSEAGVSGGSFAITTRSNEVDVAVANAVADAWKALGFNVTVKQPGTELIPAKDNMSAIYDDLYQIAYDEGDFDVILVEYNMLAPNAFSALAPFATKFSGNGVDMYSDNYSVIGHVTGYANDKYDELIEKAYAAKKDSEEMDALHEAEELLLSDMPIIPVVFQQEAYMTSKVLSGVGNTYWGRNFKKTKMDDYMKHKESIQAELAENEAEVVD